MKRNIRVVIILFAAMLLVSACNRTDMADTTDMFDNSTTTVDESREEVNDERISITVGTTSFINKELEQAALEFNKTNEVYHVSIEKYVPSGGGNFSDIAAQFQLAITVSEDCPDIVLLNGISQAYISLNYSLAEQGYFVDLMPYLETSGLLKSDNYFSNVLDAYTVDGKLMGIPRTFQLYTLYGKTSLFGEASAFSLREYVRVAKEHKDEEGFGADLSYNGICSMLLQYNGMPFVCVEDESTYVDRELLSDFLQITYELTNNNSGNNITSNEETEYPDAWRSNREFIRSMQISEARDIQICADQFGENITFLGYPAGNDNAHVILQGQDCYAINSRSDCIQGAWAFIEYYLSREYEIGSYTGFPSKIQAYNDMLADELTKDYLKNENGEYLLDNYGEKYFEGMGSTIYGNYTFVQHPLTEDEADTVTSLIENSGSIFAAMDSVIYNIIMEEAPAYFDGQKPLDTVVDVIAGRIQTYIDELQ